MAVICDGMGGLDKGELASAEVIRAFDIWFKENAEAVIPSYDIENVESSWLRLLKGENLRLMEYSTANGLEMGTTFTGMIILGDDLLIVHVGDSRIYHISNSLSKSDIYVAPEMRISAEVRQLTEDHTFVAREVRRGNMTPDEAKSDPRRNLLLQCVGASDHVSPQIIREKAEPGIYLLCSDGFRHEISESEMADFFNPRFISGKEDLQNRAWNALETVKDRGETDNISVILIGREEERQRAKY